MRNQLIEAVVASEPPTVVGLDFAFGYPKGAEESVFDSSNWQDLLKYVRQLLARSGTAIEVARKLNDEFSSKFGCQGGPFFDYSERPSGIPYQKGGFGYYRLTEHFVPQAKSPWYVGSGAQVGLSTLTGLAMLADIFEHRGGDRTVIVWPQEAEYLPEARHVIVEAYPVLMGSRKVDDQDTEDACAISRWLRSQDEDGGLTEHLDLSRVSQRWGQNEKKFSKRVNLEGWIIGV